MSRYKELKECPSCDSEVDNKYDADVVICKNCDVAFDWRDGYMYLSWKRAALSDKRRVGLHRRGLTDREIAEEEGVTPACIAMWRNRHGLKNKNRVLRMEDNHQRAMKLYEDGDDDREIAEKLGCHPTTVRRWRILNRLEANNSKHISGICKLCGVEFEKPNRATVRCLECRHEIQVCREKVHGWSKPDQRKLRDQIIEEDGEEIAEILIDGMGR